MKATIVLLACWPFFCALTLGWHTFIPALAGSLIGAGLIFVANAR
jgi:hypothetical protein